MSIGQIGQQLKFARLRRGLTQEQLAKKAGVSDRTIRRIEASEIGKTTWDTVSRIAAALGVKSFDELSSF